MLAQLLVKGDALNRAFAYDPIYRLLSASGRECDLPPDSTPWLDDPRCTDLTKARSYTENYTYNSAGSLLQLQHQSVAGTAFNRVFNVETVNNRLTSMQIGQTTFAYTFDVNGNMLSETTSRHFGWNYADQMEVFRTQTVGAEPSVYAQYLYDSSGQRVKKFVRNQGGQTEVTHYIDGVFEHHRWTDGIQTLENNYQHVVDDKQRIALIRIGPAQSGDTSPDVQYQLADHLGSSNVVVDAQALSLIEKNSRLTGKRALGALLRNGTDSPAWNAMKKAGSATTRRDTTLPGSSDGSAVIRQDQSMPVISIATRAATPFVLLIASAWIPKPSQEYRKESTIVLPANRISAQYGTINRAPGITSTKVAGAGQSGKTAAGLKTHRNIFLLIQRHPNGRRIGVGSTKR